MIRIMIRIITSVTGSIIKRMPKGLQLRVMHKIFKFIFWLMDSMLKKKTKREDIKGMDYWSARRIKAEELYKSYLVTHKGA